mmetsp:Transcript_36739/g.83122  ORF Transcript_36739/g.83122 Transcript_36739/m.83122 type:complete len:400 (-) Transcript_36739:114-1313(-)
MSIGILPAGIFESRAVRKTRLYEEESMFEKIHSTSKYFGHLELAVDGGLAREVETLYTHARLVPMLVNVIVVIVNLVRVLEDDISFLRKDTDIATDQTFLTKAFLLSLGLPDCFEAEDLVAWFEITGIICLVLLGITHLVFSRKHRSRFVRWLCVARIFREVIPELKYFSAMRLLCHVTPYVALRELKSLVADMRDRASQGEKPLRNVLELVSFFVVRAVIFAFGFDAFVVRFRKVSTHVGVLDSASIIKVTVFLNQVLGVVQLERFTMRRLSQFVFGGEDNNISAGEDRVMMAWWARLYERIWTMTNCGPLQAFATSVTFNDEDFQRLMLNEKAVEMPPIALRSVVKAAKGESSQAAGAHHAVKRTSTAPASALGFLRPAKVVLPDPVQPPTTSRSLL